MIASLPPDQSCFVDANILVYASVELVPLTQQCRAFLQRVAAREITAFTSPCVVADALFKTMVIEVAHRFAPAGTKPLAFLQKHPEVVRQLHHYPLAVEGFAKLPLRLLSADWETIRESTAISRATGLLTNDAMIVAQMRRHQLVHLITNDDDFDAIDDLTLWKPR